METRTIIHGHPISHDESVKHGIYYLSHQLDADEAKVFFRQAFAHGSAVFEDHMGHKYELIHKGGEYQLVEH